MAIEKVPIDRFLELSKQFPVLDVRSPGEYSHAHIPGAFNLPLFTDEERKVIGTAYKQQSRQAAIKIGLDYFGPRMSSIVEFVESLISKLPPAIGLTNASVGMSDSRLPTPHSRLVLIHCWRGGMRSAAIAWLLDLYGFKIYTLAGGYKKYRAWVVETFSFPFSFNILGGFTGSGKTYVLEELRKKGAAAINLEKLAHHKGSAFGNIGMPKQPSQEMFENLLCHELRKLSQEFQTPGIKSSLNSLSEDIIDSKSSLVDLIERTIKHKPQNINRIWLEDESQRIGQINIPPPLWNNMRQSPIFFLAIPFEERLRHIVQEYGILDKERMAEAIVRIQKRLGGLETKMALRHLEEDDIESCFRLLLKYYDKWYSKGLHSREQLSALLNNIECTTVNAERNASKIIEKETVLI